MEWELDRTSKKPIYKQIADFIEDSIANGVFPSDKALPSERALAKELKVNRSTVVAAYDELQSVGLVHRIHGSGTMISKNIWGITKNEFLAGIDILNQVHFCLIYLSLKEYVRRWKNSI